MPLDRAFSAKGFGTVVAGIPVAGAASLGGETVLLPQNFTSRIKRIEVYGEPSDTVLSGQCAAINLGHCDAKEVRRGDVLTLPGYFTPQEFFVCQLRILPLEKISLKNGVEVKFHTGTTEVNATLYLLQSGEIHGNSTHFVQLRMKRPIVAAAGDPFILRSFSPVRTIGGGTILEAIERRLKRNRPGIAENLAVQAAAVGDDARSVEYAVRTAPAIAISKADLARRTKTLYPRLEEILSRLVQEQKVLALTAELYLHRTTAAEAGDRLLGHLADYHRPRPGKPGHDLGAACRGLPLAKAGVGRCRAAVEGRRSARGKQSTSGARPGIGRPFKIATPPTWKRSSRVSGNRSSLPPVRPSWPKRSAFLPPRSANSWASSRSISGWWPWAMDCCFIARPSNGPDGCWSNTSRRKGGSRA